MTVQADLNVSECLVRNSAWGENVITNVCTGAVTRVPWQCGDYAEATLFGILLTLAALVMVALTAMIWQLVTEY